MSAAAAVARARPPLRVARSAVRGVDVLLFGAAPLALAGFFAYAFARGFHTFDFRTFWESGRSVLHGRSPCPGALPEVADRLTFRPFVYPVPAAFLLSPLALLPYAAANVVFAVIAAAAVLGALRLLGVEDWRCYGAAFVSLPVFDSIDAGAITPLLVLGAAALWRYRDRPLAAGALVAALVALKVFLWPLALWLGLSGRIRTALLSCAAAAAFVLVPWALIGFQGLGGYRDLLGDVARQQDRSYSLAALAEQLDVATTFARTVSVALAALLLFLAFRAAREPGREDRVRDRRSFTLALAAALTLTPVVWNHYLLLLFVPVAIARPRLSGLWALPFAANCLYVFDWYGPQPNGLAPRVAVAAIVVVTIVLSIEAQARPRSNALRPMWARVRRRRFWRSAAMGVALVSALAVAFVATPELMNDRPYNPLGRDTSHAPRPTGSGGDFGQQ